MRNQIISFLFIACLFISACSNDDDRDVRKVTDYKEYTLTVASKKLPGVVTSCGNSTLTDVYAVLATSLSLITSRGTNTKYVSVQRAIWTEIWANLPGPNTSCWKYYQRNVRIQKICRSILSRTGMRTIKVNL